MMEDFQKPRYETPIMFDLGSMAKGTGTICTGGGSADWDCTAGGNANWDCTTGGNAQGDTCVDGARVGTWPTTCIGGTTVV